MFIPGFGFKQTNTILTGHDYLRQTAPIYVRVCHEIVSLLYMPCNKHNDKGGVIILLNRGVAVAGAGGAVLDRYLDRVGELQIL